MAQWNDPRSNRTGNDRSGFGASPSLNGEALNQGVTFDEGLRSHMLSIYNYMASGVLLSGIVALMMFTSGMAASMYVSPLRFVVALAPLGIVFAMSFGANKFSTATLKLMFWAFAVLMGMSLSTIFLVYTGPSIAVSFFAAAGAFAGLSLFGYTTKKSLSGMGSFMVMGLIGLILASLLNIWIQSEALYWAVSYLGVLIFAGLTAWDTQRLKQEYQYVAGTQFAGKAVIMGALSLYLDFINMFLFLLRILGNRE